MEENPAFPLPVRKALSRKLHLKDFVGADRMIEKLGELDAEQAEYILKTIGKRGIARHVGLSVGDDGPTNQAEEKVITDFLNSGLFDTCMQLFEDFVADRKVVWAGLTFMRTLSQRDALPQEVDAGLFLSLLLNYADDLGIVEYSINVLHALVLDESAAHNLLFALAKWRSKPFLVVKIFHLLASCFQETGPEDHQVLIEGKGFELIDDVQKQHSTRVEVSVACCELFSNLFSASCRALPSLPFANFLHSKLDSFRRIGRRDLIKAVVDAAAALYDDAERIESDNDLNNLAANLVDCSIRESFDYLTNESFVPVDANDFAILALEKAIFDFLSRADETLLIKELDMEVVALILRLLEKQPFQPPLVYQIGFEAAVSLSSTPERKNRFRDLGGCKLLLGGGFEDVDPDSVLHLIEQICEDNAANFAELERIGYREHVIAAAQSMESILFFCHRNPANFAFFIQLGLVEKCIMSINRGVHCTNCRGKHFHRIDHQPLELLYLASTQDAYIRKMLDQSIFRTLADLLIMYATHAEWLSLSHVKFICSTLGNLLSPGPYQQLCFDSLQSQLGADESLFYTTCICLVDPGDYARQLYNRKSLEWQAKPENHDELILKGGDLDVWTAAASFLVCNLSANNSIREALVKVDPNPVILLSVDHELQTSTDPFELVSIPRKVDKQALCESRLHYARAMANLIKHKTTRKYFDSSSPEYMQNNCMAKCIKLLQYDHSTKEVFPWICASLINLSASPSLENPEISLLDTNPSVFGLVLDGLSKLMSDRECAEKATWALANLVTACLNMKQSAKLARSREISPGRFHTVLIIALQQWKNDLLISDRSCQAVSAAVRAFGKHFRTPFVNVESLRIIRQSASAVSQSRHFSELMQLLKQD